MKVLFFSALGLLVGCSSLEEQANLLAKKALIKASQPVLEKIFYAEAPLLPSSRSVYATVPYLPGAKFDALKDTRKSVRVLKDGSWDVVAGDYVFPVMTYCMKASGSSPRAHPYLLAALRGKNADILTALHRRGLAKFSPHEVQILSWAIQNGLPFEKMSGMSKTIVNALLPEFKKRLQTSFYEKFATNWDQIASQIPGLPRFSQLTDQFLDSLGSLGTAIQGLRRYRKVIESRGHDYATLSSLITLPGLSEFAESRLETPWSRVSPRVYARFMTDGAYQQPGYLEVRVLPAGVTQSSRATLFQLVWQTFVEPSAQAEAAGAAANFDPSSWVGDPGQSGIQPLGFSPLIAGTVLTGTATNPVAFAIALTAMLAARQIDWAKVYQWLENATAEAAREAREVIAKAHEMARKEHDALEKPARDAGVIDGSCRDTTDNPNNPTRQYDKPGGKGQLKEDFDNLPYPQSSTADGKRVKTAPDGTRYVERPDSSGTTPSTLEIQPPDAGRGGGNPTRVKIRYP